MMKLLLSFFALSISAWGQISVASNTISDRKMLFNSSVPYPAKVAINGTGTNLSLSCSGAGCTYAKYQLCVVDSSPCTTTTTAPAYLGLAFGEVFHTSNTYNLAAGTYPVSITITADEGCTGSCAVASNLVVVAAKYPAQTSPSGSMSGCSSGGSEPTYHFSPNGEKDLCTITNVRPGGTWNMPTFGNSVADPQFGSGRTFPQSGTYKRISPTSQRAIGGDTVTSQFNLDASLVLTNDITPGTGTLIALATDGTTGDVYTGLPSGNNTWSPTDSSVMFYTQGSQPTVRKVTLNGCPSPPCNSSAWTDTSVYSYPGGTSVAVDLINGGSGMVSREGLWPLYTYRTTQPAIVLVDTTAGTAVTKTLSYSDIPLLCPQNGAASGNGYFQHIQSISNTTPPVVETAATHGFITDQTVFIDGSDVSAYNGTWKITYVDSTHFSIPTTAAGAATNVGDIIRWAPRLVAGAPAISSNGRYYMVMLAYPGGSNYIFSWAPGESTITIDGPQAATRRQVYGPDSIGTNSFYDGAVPNHALCNAGYCVPSFHISMVMVGGDAALLWPSGASYPAVVHQYLSRFAAGPSEMENPVEFGGGMVDLQAVGQHDQHQGCSLFHPICVMDNDGDSPDLTAYKVSGATNASPIVITTTSAYGGSNGDVLLINGVQGNTAANGLCTVANLSGTTFECSGSTGNGTYTANTGSLVKNTAPAQQSYQAETWTLDFTRCTSWATIGADCLTINRLLVHRSWSWSDRIGGNYYGQPHFVISPDGKWIAGESNGGVPDDYNVFLAPTGFISGSSSAGPHSRRGPVTMR